MLVIGIKMKEHNISKSQILITGVYRSGTQFIVRNLNLHPELSATEYKVNVLRFVLDRYDPFHLKENYSRALNDVASRMLERYKDKLNIEKIQSRLESFQKVDYGNFYDEIMSELYLWDKKCHWAEKSQLEWRTIPRFIKMMNNGKVFHILRDPRAVLLSFKKYTIAPPPGYLGAIWNCFDSMKFAVEYQRNSELSNRHHIIRYEDVALDTINTTKKAWEFLELSKVEVDFNDRSNWTTEKGEKWFSNSSFQENVESSFDVKKAMNRWKELLSKEEIILTEAVCGEYMKIFGYEILYPNVSEREVESALSILTSGDQIINNYYQDWKTSKLGIQTYPLNPLDAKTWR